MAKASANDTLGSQNQSYVATPTVMPAVFDPRYNPNPTALPTATTATTSTATSTSGTTTTAASPAVTTAATSNVDLGTQDAFALIQQGLAQWGLNATDTASFSQFLQNEMKAGVGPNQAVIDLRSTPMYQQRFAGNAARVAAGLNALTEADYISLENSYTTTMESYGVSNLGNRTTFANLIGNDVSASELSSRLALAIDQVQNADPQILSTLKAYYPTVSQSDLVSYFISPTETLPQLKQQVLASQIGTYATEQLAPGSTIPEISQARALQLAQAGVTAQQAQAGYQTIGMELPAAQKLAQIYKTAGIGYDQSAAEAEQFNLTGGAQAALNKNKLINLEESEFQGRSGIMAPSVAGGYTGTLGRPLQGQF
jgi:hypothetical protein